MKRRRVKITGIGPVTPAGIGKEAFWKGIQEPVSRVRPFRGIGHEYGPLVAAHMEEFNVEDFVPRAVVPKGAARHTEFAIAGAVLALKDANLTAEELKRTSCAIVTGSSLLDFGGIGEAIDMVKKRGARGALPRVVYTTTLTSVVESLNVMLGLNARTMSLQTSCCSGLDAIGYATEMVAKGEASIALCGGVEAPLHRFPLLELRAAGLTPTTDEMPEKISRPFDLWRTTGVVSEGGCMLVLEDESSPRPGYCWISGWAAANDENGHLCSGLVTAERLALALAGLRPNEIDSISAWGPGHKQIDRTEVQAMSEVFGPRLRDIPTVSIKGAVGAALGAAPAIQVGAAALAHREGIMPPTVNWEFRDPECDLDLSGRARYIDVHATMINAHGVGKINSAMVLQRCS